MSVLSYPRIHFHGRFYANPATGNNDDVRVTIDAEKATLSPDLAAMTNDQVRSWLIQDLEAENPLYQGLRPYLHSGWNLYGDMSAWFQDATVCKVVGPDGQPAASDPLIGLPVQILGSFGGSPKLVDLDPRGGVATQVFLGGFSLGDSTFGLTATHQTRCYSRWIHIRTCGNYDGDQAFVGGGATWQFAIPHEDIAYEGAARSPMLRALQSAGSSCLGLLVQFATYGLEPRLTDAELIASYRSGQFPRNPAIGSLVGTVGLWEPGELMSSPEGRRMAATSDAESRLGLSPPFVSLGPALARVHPSRATISLNLITTFPEANFDRPPQQKADLGEITLGLIPKAQSNLIPLATVPYDYPTYWSSGGIVDVAYDPSTINTADLERGTLVLVSDQDSTGPILSEDGCTIVAETDDRALYVEPGESVEIRIKVTEKGGPPRSDVTLTFFEHQNVQQEGGPQKRSFAVIRLVDPAANPAVLPCLSYPASVVFPKGRTTPLAVSVSGIRTGAATLAFTQNGQPLPTLYAPMAGFANIRVMPDDRYDHVPDSVKLTWSFVYNEIFRLHDLLFPAMSQYIPFENEDAMTQAAALLVDRTDPANWASPLYMPATRDLSAGKRKLLVDWANSVLARADGAE